MESYVGTSGWSYEWNKGGDLSWYVEKSGLNAIELNASFYRFPREAYVKRWSERGRGLRWSVKVHRSVTHTHKFNAEALEVWKRFRDRFIPLDSLVDFYLFQAPPRFHDLDRITGFLQKIGPSGRIALELRDAEMLGDDPTCEGLQQHSLLVSVDSPDFQNRIFYDRSIYLRMHGREDWYQHAYTRKELEETLEIIYRHKPERLFVFFNNDHHMLQNASLMRHLLNTSQAERNLMP